MSNVVVTVATVKQADSQCSCGKHRCITTCFALPQVPGAVMIFFSKKMLSRLCFHGDILKGILSPPFKLCLCGQAASTLRKALHEPMNEACLCTPCSELEHDLSQGTFQANCSKVFLSHQWSSTKGATWVLTLCRQRVQATQASHKPKWKRGRDPFANSGMLHQLITRFQKSKHSLNGQ